MHSVELCDQCAATVRVRWWK